MFPRSITMKLKTGGGGPPLPGIRNHRNSNAGLMTTKAKTYDREDLTMNSQSQSQFSSVAAGAMIDKDLVASGISDKDLEIEHLQTQLVALTQKSDVVEDIRKDLDSHKALLQESELKRVELQEQISYSIRSVQQVTQEQLEIIERQGSESQGLRSELEETKLTLANREQDHQNRQENVFQAHKLRSDSLTQQNLDSLLHSTNAHHIAMETLQLDHKLKFEEQAN